MLQRWLVTFGSADYSVKLPLRNIHTVQSVAVQTLGGKREELSAMSGQLQPRRLLELKVDGRKRGEQGFSLLTSHSHLPGWMAFPVVLPP